MTTLQIDQNLKSKLCELSVPIQFCDEQGRKLGYFVSVENADAAIWDWARSAFSNEELVGAQNEEGGFTLREIINELTGQ